MGAGFRNSRSSNEFNPKIILNNSIKSGADQAMQSVNNNGNSFIRSSKGSLPDFFMNNNSGNYLNQGSGIGNVGWGLAQGFLYGN